MLLLVGLGNPGIKYKSTKHNFGFLLVDLLADNYQFSSPINKFNSQIYIGEINGEKTIMIKPQTYMNCSGSPVQQVMSFYKIPLQNMIVFHDDIDLKLGKVKIKIGGGSAGHNGLNDIDEVVGKDYSRVRLGIGRPENFEYEIADYVLSKFNNDEMNLVDDVSKKISKLMPLIISGRMEDFMNQFALLP